MKLFGLCANRKFACFVGKFSDLWLEVCVFGRMVNGEMIVEFSLKSFSLFILMVTVVKYFKEDEENIIIFNEFLVQSSHIT